MEISGRCKVLAHVHFAQGRVIQCLAVATVLFVSSVMCGCQAEKKLSTYEEKALLIAINAIQERGYNPELMESTVRSENENCVVHFSLVDGRMGGDATVVIDSRSWKVISFRGSQ